MTTISIPALRGDDPLGFLAALGLLALSEQGELPPLRLGWVGRSAPIASVDASVPDVEALSLSLTDAFARIRQRGEVVPGLGPDFPLPPAGSTTDPMRMSREDMARWYAVADERWRLGEPWFARWLIALAAQTAVSDEDRGDVVLTPFYAPTGRMTMRVSIFDKTVEAVEVVGGPGDAVRRWRRARYDGANFDDRAKRDAGVTTWGKADNQGAPSATWLAAMAIRLFTIVDKGLTARAVGWQPVRMYPGFTARSLVWPIWSKPLDAAAIRVLLSHDALRLAGVGTEVAPADPPMLEALGVGAVFGTSRRTLSQGDGPLGPARRLWPVLE